MYIKETYICFNFFFQIFIIVTAVGFLEGKCPMRRTKKFFIYLSKYIWNFYKKMVKHKLKYFNHILKEKFKL